MRSNRIAKSNFRAKRKGKVVIIRVIWVFCGQCKSNKSSYSPAIVNRRNVSQEKDTETDHYKRLYYTDFLDRPLSMEINEYLFDLICSGPPSPNLESIQLTNSFLGLWGLSWVVIESSFIFVYAVNESTFTKFLFTGTFMLILQAVKCISLGGGIGGGSGPLFI